MHKLIIIHILLLAGLVSGCSSTSLMYNNAPWFIREKVDDYFSISDIQEQQLDRDIERVFEWHRRTELPEYAIAISSFNDKFADGLTTAELDFIFELFIRLRNSLAEASLDTATTFLSSVSARQIQYYDRGHKKRLTESQEELDLSPQERSEQRFTDLLDKLEGWLGNFNQKQQHKIRLISDSLPDNRAYWLGQRERRHQEFLTLLGSKPDRAAINSFLRRRFAGSYSDTAEHRDIRLQSRAQWKAAMLQIDGILTPAQRQRLIARLNDYRSDFIVLSRQFNSEHKEAAARGR